MWKFVKAYLPIVPALILFALIARYLNFTQDDAYISYRYVANFLNGHGLVYNIGERVEGFTNFGWVISMILTGGIGLGYIAVSKITGLILGAGVIVVTYLIARFLFEDKSVFLAAIPAYLLAANLSLAYWSPAGLETAAFAFVCALSVYWFLRRNNLLIVGLLLAVWIRPEGAVLAGLVIVAESISRRSMPVFAVRCALIALVLSLPFVAFKIIYYHSLLPNPFYAKTGMNAVTLQNGAEYVWGCLRDYGAGGIGIVAAAIFWKRLSESSRAVLVLVVGYLGYVLVIGGDVLKVHRFFLPIAGLSAVLIILAVQTVFSGSSKPTRQFVTTLVSLVILIGTIYLPWDTVRGFNRAELAFTARMGALAEDMKESDSTNFSVALPTIGIVGYTLLGHDIIDMVGLTDSTIARYSEEPVPGMITTWKERKHNSGYLLGRAPDYIVFSTGVKPSAPAEKALMMYPSFQNSYRAIGWSFTHPLAAPNGSRIAAFKKVRPVEGPFRAEYPLEYVDDMKMGTEAYLSKDYTKGVALLERAIKVAGGLKPSPELLYTLGFCRGALRGDQKGLDYWNQAVAQDSFAFAAHCDLYLYETAVGDRAKGLIHRAWLNKISPWYVPRLDTLLADALRRAGRPVPEN